MQVLLTGMPGTGKSALACELRRRGYPAYDADEDGFSEPRADGRWGWRYELVADLLAQKTDRPLFFAGCSEEQIDLPFDYRVLLTAPRSVTALAGRRSPARAHRRNRRDRDVVLRGKRGRVDGDVRALARDVQSGGLASVLADARVQTFAPLAEQSRPRRR